MDREPVRSSNIASVGYDADSKILEVEFHGGGVYQYVGLPPALYDQLLVAASKGQFLNDHIKGHYSYRKVH